MLNILAQAIHCTLQHHERMDGSLPGLSGEEILLLILAVADVVEAMASLALSLMGIESALEEIRWSWNNI